MSAQYKVPQPFVALLWMTLAIGGASLVAVGQPDASRHPSLAQPDADFDGDGIVNALDNCLVGPNADQRDSDHDGVGNACDADFNNDGVVDELDLAALREAFGTSARDKDLNGDGVVDKNDLRIARELAKGAPARLDSDGDRVPDLEDPCPEAAPGPSSSVRGCPALALLQKPDAILGPLASKARRIANELRVSEMLEVRANLESAADDITAAERSTRAGDVCGSGRLFAHADDVLAAALDDIDRQLADVPPPIPTTAGATGGPATADYLVDVSETNMLVAGLKYWGEQVAGVRARSRVGAGAFASICAATHPGTARGVIQSLDDAKRRIVLTDGRTLGLADPITVTDDIYEGRAVQIGGLMFDDGSGHATTVKHDGAAPSVPPAAFVSCTALRFTPVQRLPPVSSGPFVLHDPLGYKAGEIYTVEAGMGVGAQAKCSPGQGGRSYPRYSLKVEISYQQANTGTAIHHASMAPELTPSDDPVLFAKDIDPNAPATLHVTNEVRSCTKANGFEQCADPTLIVANDYPLVVRPRGALAFAQYDQTEFDVNDQKSGDFRFAHVSFFTALADVDGGTSQTFVAEGYGPFFEGIIEDQIVNGDPFAIRNIDFYPIFPAVTQLGAFLEMVATAVSGVDHAAGLRWPRVQGTRNGREFWYSASLPTGIIRDVVNLCAEAPHAYYRLPFAENFVFVQGQGNHPELAPGTPGVSHSGGYAYDMLAPLNTPIRAARAGRVVQIEESLTDPCGIGGDCLPNNVFIKHQDGSIGEYVHMPQNSVLPEVGDLVKRGEQIAVVGLVGPTTGPHLHFATRTQPKPGGETFLAKFEAVVINFPQVDLMTCYVPQEGALLGSNNKSIP